MATEETKPTEPIVLAPILDHSRPLDKRSEADRKKRYEDLWAYHESEGTKLDPRERLEKYPMGGKRWSAEHDAMLMQLRYTENTMPYREIAKRLGRTALSCRLRRLHIEEEANGGKAKGKGKRKAKRKQQKRTLRTKQAAAKKPTAILPAAPGSDRKGAVAKSMSISSMLN